MNTVNYKGTNEVIHITRYHLLLVLERLQNKRPKFPLFEHVLIPFSVMLPTLVTFLTADFKDSLGLSAAVWQMLILAVMVISTLVTLVFLGLWSMNRASYKPKIPDEIVEEIIQELERRNKDLTNS